MNDKLKETKKDYFDNISGIEILSKRGKREKHFLQKDGSIIARMYSDDIHFLKNGKYEEIDNSLEKVGSYYKTKNNSFNAYFNNNSTGKFLGYELPQGNLSFELLNNNEVNIEIIDNNSKFNQTVKYKNIFDGIDFEYCITTSKIKENIIIKDKESITTPINFILHTNFDLSINTTGEITVSRYKEPQFTIEAPYMLDDNKIMNNNVVYELKKLDAGYMLSLILDEKWLASNDTKFPVIIDPTISTYDGGKVYDTYIFPGDTNVNRNGQDILKAGVEKVNGRDIINRSLVKFELPTIGTGSQVYEAYLNLTSYSIYSITNPFEIRRLVDIHRVTADWTESGANWNSMNDKFDKRIECSNWCSRSWEEYSWEGNVMTTHIIPYGIMANVTSLVKKWYTGTPNYGVMIKAHKEIYDSAMLPAFYSNNNTVIGDNPKPTLEVIYRNQNGLEGYMNYQTQTFNDGIIYNNTYNGNLFASFEIGSTIDSKTPWTLNLIYNTNDVVLNNNVGLGNGYKFNFWQTVKFETIGKTNYLQYVDEDGTIHYFYEENGIYKDEDNLNMEIEINETEYILKDKYNNQLIFGKINEVGYLKEIKNVQGDTINIQYNSDNLIQKIIDSDNQTIDIIYETDKISIISPYKTVTINYNENKIVNIVNLEGTTHFVYNENDLISKVIDIDGTSVCYEYYDQKPYRLKSVVEYGMNNHKGASFKLEYGHKSTTIIDNKDRATVISYNDYANPVSASNLKSKDDISNAYGTDYNYGEWEEYKNKLISNKIPVKHVNNFLKNTSFESDTILFSSTENVVLSISNECSYSGSKSLKIVNTSETGKVFQTITVDKGNNYTFSAFVKNNNPLKFKLSYTNEDGVAVEKEGEIINIDEDFNRYDVTMFYPKDAISDLCINFEMLAPGVTYIDNVQLEEGEVANHFNYIENSDFRMGLGDLNYDSNDNDMSHFEVVTLSDGKSKALKINMDPEYDTYISKEFKVSGQAGDEYNISFWYKNKGIIPANDGPLNGSAVWLRAVYTDPDDWHTQHCVPINHLNPSEDEWQYFSASYTTESAYDGFVIDFGQSGDANELYITNLSLFKSVGSSGYDYDIKGNLTSVIGTNKETNNFVYDVNNQLVKSINPKGKKLMYEYDNDIQGRLLRNISEMGICNEMKYDSRDNCTLSRINKKGITNTITDDLYKIRNKGTSLYLRNIVNSIQLKDNCQCHDLWKLEKVEDYYKISHSIVPNKYFTVQNNKLILSPFNGDNSLFTLLENSNGSYSIQLKETSEYIKNNNNELIATAYVYDNPAFEFYFEPNDEQHFMETNYEFTEDGRFIKSVTDTNLNKLTYDIDSVTGLTRSTTNSKNQTSVYQYDDKHRLLSIKVNDNRQVNYIYNDYNLLDKIKFGTKEYNFTYDDFMNNKTLRINNDITLLTNNYEDNNGNLLSSIYGNNHAIGYDYDEFDRIKKINRMDNIYQFKYGNNGDLLKVIDNSHAIKFSYDLGKRLTEYRTDRFHFKNTYDITGNIITKEYDLDDINHKNYNVFNDDDNLVKMKLDDCELNYTYDKLGRISSSIINDIINTHYEYVTNGKRTSTLVKSYSCNSDNYHYTYDKLNNLTHIYHNNQLQNKYYYNQYNELIMEDNYLFNKTITYTYDNCGNLLFKKEYNLRTDNLINEYCYEYNNLQWEDQLTKFNNQLITYDEIGNPLTIGDNISLEWINGKQLKSYTDTNNNIAYKYDYTNARTEKVVNGVKTKYYLEGTNIIFEETNNNVIYYMYNALGGLLGFKYNDTLYYYVKNFQNDIIAILDNTGSIVAKYNYDSWGNIISVTDAFGNDISNDMNHIANINPFRYRSYYFDKETNLYYLNSRYYNPLWGRFLNADDILIQSSSLTGYNLFAYTNNNPINTLDSSGNIPLPFVLLAAGALVAIGVGLYKKNKKSSNKKKSGSSGTKKTGGMSSGGGTRSNSSVSKAKPQAMNIGALASIALPVAAVDGPAPFADIIVLTVLAIGAVLSSSSTADLDLDAEGSSNTPQKNAKPCTKATWGNNGNIIRIGKRLTTGESVQVVESGGNLMCDDHDSAYAVAIEFPGYYLDKKHRSGPNYYHHYHPYKAKNHPHIWFYGEIPK